MKKMASERLIARVRQFKPGSIGISAEDIVRVPLTAEVIGEIEECLSSQELSELKWGLWFANGILGANPPQEFLKKLLPRVPNWLGHENWDIRGTALEIFVRLRDNYKNYKEIMLTLLRDPEAVIRWHALERYRTFLTKQDISVLLEFKNDDYMSETEMGSPLVYVIRNLALEAIEDLCGEQFRKSENVKHLDGSLMVYWWDWQPFLDWWNGREQHGWSFWRK